MSEHIDVRRKIRDIPRVSTFNTLLDASTLSEEDKTMLRLHYLEKKDFRFIGDSLGYAESTIKYRHRKAIKKLSKLL